MNEDLIATDPQNERHGTENEQDGNPRRPAAVSSGNPRINVALPFGRIAVQEPSEALRDLAGLVEQMAGQLAMLTRQADNGQADNGQAEAADRLAAQAAVLARRIGAG